MRAPASSWRSPPSGHSCIAARRAGWYAISMASCGITWEAPEFECRDKGVAWYCISIIVAAIIVAFAVWEKNFLFGLFIVIAEVLFIVWGNRLPRMIGLAASEAGITIEEVFYAFRDFENVSIDTPFDGF